MCYKEGEKHMSIKISQLSKLKNLKKFNLLAGESGFEKEVSSVCLADLELDNNLTPYANGFRRGSFVIASMRENEALKKKKFIDLIKRLIELKCVGLAVNIRMIKKPSKSVLDFCDKENFPLFAFDPEEVYIENVVFDIMQAIHKSAVSFSMDREIKYMLEGTMSRDEVDNIARTINPMFFRNCIVYYLWDDKENSEFNAVRIAKNYGDKGNSDGIITSLMTYRNGIIAIVSMNTVDPKISYEIVSEILSPIEDKNGIKIVVSDIHLSYDELDKAFRECAEAYIVAHIDNKHYVKYDDIGIYKLLLRNRNQPEFVDLMNRYLSVMNREQLETAILFVLLGGDYDKVSKKMICHRNTVRYRIGKIHERTDPEADDFSFLESLSAAIKLYLASKVR